MAKAKQQHTYRTAKQLTLEDAMAFNSIAIQEAREIRAYVRTVRATFEGKMVIDDMAARIEKATVLTRAAFKNEWTGLEAMYQAAKRAEGRVEP